MDGDLARVFCELNPSFIRKGEETIYLRCLKALYGHIEAVRLFYNELNYSLTKRMGFERNKYDPCVYNRKSEDGSITTIKTHVDDLKVSSKSKGQLQKVVKDLRDIYQEITVHEGDIHDYLGIIMKNLLLKVINLSGDFSFPSTAQQKAQINHFLLLIPKFNFIHNIPIANFQVFMVSLIPSVSNTLFITTEQKSRREPRSVSGFASLLTSHAVSKILDTVTVQVRSCVTVEALTPINFRIVRVSANIAFNQLDLTSIKRLVNYMEVLGDGGIIVHELLHVPKKKQLPIPLNILTSPFLHMLYFRDIDDVQRQWRAGILLHYDFLSNARNRAEISRYHAKAGISVQFDRLTWCEPMLLDKDGY
jgi:hypothetical protein